MAQKTGQRWTHDCDQCVYLGPFGAYDLYACIDGWDIAGHVARYGTDGPDYISASILTGLSPELQEVRLRALAVGYRSIY